MDIPSLWFELCQYWPSTVEDCQEESKSKRFKGPESVTTEVRPQFYTLHVGGVGRISKALNELQVTIGCMKRIRPRTCEPEKCVLARFRDATSSDPQNMRGTVPGMQSGTQISELVR